LRCRCQDFKPALYLGWFDVADRAVAQSTFGTEFVVNELRKWLGKVGMGTLYIEPGGPSEDGYHESFNGKLRDECLNGEIFHPLKEARIVIENGRLKCNTRKPHSAPGDRPPTPAAYRP